MAELSVLSMVLAALFMPSSVMWEYTFKVVSTDSCPIMENGSFSFSATEEGGYVDVTYYGYASFVRADLTVKIEKNFLFFFWSEIDTWSASSTELNGEFYTTIPLDGSATYRATFTLKVTGNDGTVDTITDVIESYY